MAETLTIGKILVNNAIPEDMRDNSRVFSKQGAYDFFRQLAEKRPDEYAEILHKLNNVSRDAATAYGGAASISLKDLQIPPKMKAYREQIRQQLHAISQREDITTEQKNAAIVQLMSKEIPSLRKNLTEEVKAQGGAFGQQVGQGIRGNPVQLSQILFGDMLVADHKGKPVPIAGTHGYGEGVTPQEYWAGSYASRAGYISVQFATAKTGFLGKQLAMMAQQLAVTSDDCGADNLGIPVEGSNPEIIGSVLAAPAGGLPAGTVVEKKHLSLLRKDKPLVRSIITCLEKSGVCQKCAGKREKGEFPDIGEQIGINAGRLVSEPATQQLALSAKHSGGAVGVTDKDAEGFDEINQFVQIPQNFKGKSVLAPEDGVVRQIVEAPQGGHYLHVNQQQLYVPPGREISAKVGQKVEAGEMLTDGTPNPGEIAQLKGLGEGRVYFSNKFGEILRNNGIPSHKRNVEALARSFFDKVRITDFDGIGDNRYNEVVSYNALQSMYKPRKDAKTLSPNRLVGKYLETPSLHYTIGTRITDTVADDFKKRGITQITAHDNPPGFEPEIIRIMALPSADQDWKVNMAGFGIKKSFLENARTGSTSRNDSTSYIPKLMDPVRL